MISFLKSELAAKNQNILAIAEEANISVDSLVFIDDSDFEIELIKQTLPEVKTLPCSKQYF